MFDMKGCGMLCHVRRRRCMSFFSVATYCIIPIFSVLMLMRLISSFSPSVHHTRRFVSQKKRRSSIRESASTDAGVEHAIKLGQSEFEKYFEFPLDDWQLQAGGSISMGHNVIVCAPTGSGKTVVGEMALHSAFDRHLEGIYTTPLKALSNQKFSELRQIFGNTNVGLSTGDISVNRDAARLTVMTTEVYRNIAWRTSGEEANEDKASRNDLTKNSVVVLDEFHYMGQPGRGGVWEECVITSPSHTQIIGLSATLANARELAEWMENVTGRQTKLIEAPGARPVPLKYLFATREGIFPLFRNADAGPGSPLGLLGYRGDGIPSNSDSFIENKKDGQRDTEGFVKRLPKGLGTNPALNRLAQNRIQRVNRQIEKQKANQRSYIDSFDEFDLYPSSRKGRGRGRGRGRKSSAIPQNSNRVTRKERERLTRKEMRKAVPSLTTLLTRLKERNLLPAIFFIFSRAGCDQTAEIICNYFKGPRSFDFDREFQNDIQKLTEKKNRFGGKSDQQQKRSNKKGDKRRNNDNDVVKDNQGRSFRLSSNNIDDGAFNSVLEANRIFSANEFSPFGSPLSSENWNFYSSSGLLNSHEVKEVAGLVAQFNNENPEIAFPDYIIEQLLFGLGRHHAGMLPAHKMLVENLFRMNLIRAVFATETLSAGINMPARTTVICSLAKRSGSGAMALLETSNLLQMAGRAGRRGMDTTGTCVLVATPFEGEDVAASLLTDPIKPISSQFRPSYSLAMNLITRGNGKLDVAKQLVSRSFANWSRQRIEEARRGTSKLSEVSEILEQVAEEKFINSLINHFESMIQRRSAKVDISFLTHLTETLKDRKLLKKSSKKFDAVKLTFELECTTLGCLEQESKYFSGDQVSLTDEDEILRQVDEQQTRVRQAEKQLRRHPFSSIANIANEILKSELIDGKGEVLQEFKKIQENYDCSSLDAEDIARFAKSTVVVKRKLKKLKKSNPGVDPETLLHLETQKLMENSEDSTWKDMLAITEVLIAFGCITPTSGLKKEHSSEDLEDEIFEVTPAGTDLGMLSFENSLWCYLAMGGTYDITNASAKFDEMKEALQTLYSNEEDAELVFDKGEHTDEKSRVKVPSKAQEEAETLLYNLQELSPGEMAGYVSCLVTGDSGRNNRVDSIGVFKRLGPRLQRSIQVLLDVTERFADVQRQYFVEEKSCICQFDLSHCEVVTAWANGCTWNEALEISGVAPGDLARIIGRATDAVRQFGALKYNPIRKNDLNPELGGVDPLSRGIHPEVRRLCREAAMEMNRYPVKDTLPFNVEEDEIFSENFEDSYEEDGTSDEGTSRDDRGTNHDDTHNKRREEPLSVDNDLT